MIHFVSRSGCSSAVVFSFVCWAIVFFIRIPTPPPFLFLFFPIRSYPLMLICCFLSSFVSVISAMLALVAFRSDSMLLTLLLMPLTLTVIMVICLFFSDSGPFVFPWSVQVTFVSCWDYLDVGGSKCYFLSFLVSTFVIRWRAGSVGVFVVCSGSGFVVFCLSDSGLFISDSSLFWFLLCFFPSDFLELVYDSVEVVYI